MHCRPTYREREGEKEEEIGERERKIEKERDREIRGSLFSFFFRILRSIEGKSYVSRKRIELFGSEERRREPMFGKNRKKCRVRQRDSFVASSRLRRFARSANWIH